MAAFAPVWEGWARTGRAAGRAAPDFRALVGEQGWADLPLAVRARFARHDAERTYPGAMDVRASLFGRLLAQLCRLLGTPLAPWTGDAVPVSVRVWLDDGALVWGRTYRFAGRAPLMVTSRKVTGPGGQLMEIARGGLGMRLATSVEAGVLHFRSTGYFWAAAGLRLPIPAWLTPGAADVIHRDEGGGRFTFAMRFVHPLFGESLFQSGVFEDPT